jgi:hypothetical protein
MVTNKLKIIYKPIELILISDKYIHIFDQSNRLIFFYLYFIKIDK